MDLHAKLSKNLSILLLTLGPAIAGAGPARDEEASFEAAIRHFENEEYAESRTLLRELVQLQPESALYWYNLGNACLLLGRYREAAVAYSKVDRIGGALRGAANMYRVRAHVLLGNETRVQELLAELGPDRLPEIARSDLTEARLPSVAPAPRANPWSLVVDGSVGAADARPGFQLSLATAYLARREPAHSLRLGLQMSWLEGYSAAASGFHAAGGATFIYQPALAGGWVFSLEPYLIFRMVDRIPASLSPSLRLASQHRWPSATVGLEYALERIQPLSGDFEPWRGEVHQLRAYWSTLGQDPEWRVGAAATHDTATGLTTAGPEVCLTTRLDAAWAIDAYASLVFGRIPVDDPLGDERLDALAPQAGLRALWEARADLLVHSGLSTSMDAAGTRWSGSAGVTWSAL